jgi:hypothetical protein
MATDFIVFIHGVNTRSNSDFRLQAMNTFRNISKTIQLSPGRDLKPVILFWGNIAEQDTNDLAKQLKSSPTWDQFWFQDLRLERVVPFVGDAALYLSRTVSIKILEQITAQALEQLGWNSNEMKQQPPIGGNDGDRLHLVTHSWGTVILFDILFATRWEEASLPANIKQAIETLRSCFFGVGKINPGAGEADIKNFGIPIASLHTMGSPIALFNLINSSGGQGFNLTPRLKEFLESSANIMGRPLPWQNYAHPGDPIAYPLTGVMNASLGEANSFVSIKDLISPTSYLDQLLGKSPISIIKGGDAHGSYWDAPSVSKNIVEVIESTFVR